MMTTSNMHSDDHDRHWLGNQQSLEPLPLDDMHWQTSFCSQLISDFEVYPGDRGSSWKDSVKMHIDEELGQCSASIDEAWIDIRDKMLFYPFTIYYTMKYLRAKRLVKGSDNEETKQHTIRLMESIREWSRLDLTNGLPKLYGLRLDLSLFRGGPELNQQGGPSKRTPSPGLLEFNELWSPVFDHAMHHDYQDLANRLTISRKAVLSLPKLVLEKSVDYLDKLSEGRFDGHVQFRRLLVNIAKARTIVPAGLFIHGVERQGEYPVTGGGYADVWKGKHVGKDVALKILREFGKPGINSPNHQLFFKEAMIWRALKHPNVLPFLGVYEEFLPRQIYSFVSPWMEHGNLLIYLRMNQNADKHRLMHGVTLGLAYLHRHRIVHGDLTSANVLIDHCHRPRIMDFGLAKITDSKRNPMSALSGNITGNLRWLAPELMLGLDHNGNPCTGIPSTESDVYAYACVLLEIFTCNKPFHYYHNDAIVSTHVALHDERPARPAPTSGITDQVWRIMQRCWLRDASRRPSIDNIVSELLPHQHVETDDSDEDIYMSRRSSTVADSNVLTVPTLSVDTGLLARCAETPDEKALLQAGAPDSLAAQRSSEFRDDFSEDTSVLESIAEDNCNVELGKLGRRPLNQIILLIADNSQHGESRTDPDLEAVFDMFKNICLKFGLLIRKQQTFVIPVNANELHTVREVQAILKRHKRSQSTIVTVVLSKPNRHLRTALDRLFCQDFGTLALEMFLTNLRSQEGREAYLQSYVLKIRAMLGCDDLRFHCLAMDFFLLDGTMLVGLDVTDPGADVPGSLAVAAIVANCEKTCSFYPGSFRLQTAGSERIEDLREMMIERLDTYLERTKRFPERILVFRYDVPEGQSRSALQADFQEIKAAVHECTMDDDPLAPRVTMAICKRPNSCSTSPWTSPPTIDYASGHDENEWTINELEDGMQELSKMCNATRSCANVPPPLFWAGVALRRVQRYVWHGWEAGGGKDGYLGNEIVHKDVAGSMFYV